MGHKGLVATAVQAGVGNEVGATDDDEASADTARALTDTGGPFGGGGDADRTWVIAVGVEADGTLQRISLPPREHGPISEVG